MKWWGYLTVGMPFAVMLFVIIVLAFGPVFLQIREWYWKRKGNWPKKNRKYYRSYRAHF